MNDTETGSRRRRKAVAVLAPISVCLVLAFLGMNMGDESRSLTGAYLKLTTTLKQASHRPPLSDLIDTRGNNKTRIVGDVQFLLDFAIIAHSKCGTTALLNWICHHSEVQMHCEEIHSLKKNKPAELVSRMYDLRSGSHYKRGYKAPNDLRSDAALHAIQSHWPQTKLVIGLRHPVRWMESFYNFRSRNGRGVPSGQVMKGLGDLPPHVQFHLNLANLGKTNRTDQENRLLGPDTKRPRLHLGNKVFLYEISQPSDTNETRSARFRKDLSDFIGLVKPLDPLERPEKSANFHYAIDICDEKYSQLRARLVENGKVAATWIRDYFLPLSDVTVSSPSYFEELLQNWSIDPCDEASQASAATAR